MLQHLYINNYAIIHKLEIDFNSGMNVITGETGAGKSIIVGALNLILGARADSTALVNKEKKCIIEGRFIAGDNKLVVAFLQANDLDIQREIVVRREIATTGKSRAFINDTPVNLSQLHDLSELLVDLHQQFDTLSMGENDFQLNVLDALSDNQTTVATYNKTYQQWQNALRALNHLRQQQIQFEKESDYNRFQYEELADAGFKEHELENIEAELKLLSNSEGIKTALGKAHSELSESEQPVVQQLKSMVHLLRGFSDVHQGLASLTERLQSAQIELQDISAELEHLNEDIHYDAEKIEQLNERLSLGYKLLKKHGINSTAALLTIQNELEEKLQAVLHISDNIEQLEKQSAGLHRQLLASGETISKARKKQVPHFESEVNRLLKQVGMPNASLKVSMEAQAPSLNGLDNIQFLFDANRSSQYKPVSKVASGGELSRLMLCIKSLVAEKMDLPTLIFDEIDTGISGEAAKQVGVIMKELAENRQVICITHQPQIAGKADTHFFVYKELNGETVQTNIRQLGKDERINTIAQMLGGAKPTAAALENAREMVNG